MRLFSDDWAYGFLLYVTWMGLWMPSVQAIDTCGGESIAKVNKAYSLDLETIQLIEEYTNGGQNSRSRLVNNAIRWYLSGDGKREADLQEEILFLQKIIADRKPTESEQTSLSWWRRLLLGR